MNLAGGRMGEVQKKLSTRRRWSRQEREALVAEYRRGKVTQRALAARAGISVSCLGLWLRKAEAADASAWVELPEGLPAGREPAGYTVRFAKGAVLELPRGFSFEEAARLCRELARL
jgi:hypothetical protein